MIKDFFFYYYFWLCSIYKLLLTAAVTIFDSNHHSVLSLYGDWFIFLNWLQFLLRRSCFFHEIKKLLTVVAIISSSSIIIDFYSSNMKLLSTLLFLLPSSPKAFAFESIMLGFRIVGWRSGRSSVFTKSSFLIDYDRYLS